MAADPAPPIARRVPVTRELHGETVVDDYAWLKDRHDPGVIAYLEAENTYTEAMTAGSAGLRERIFHEIKSRIQETDLAVPARRGPYWYSSRTEEGKSYRVWVRMAEGPDGPEEVILDENLLAEGHDYFALANLAVAPDHDLLAYSIDVNGSERYRTRFRRLSSGEELPDEIPLVYYGAAWAEDAATYFYTVPDDAMRPWQVWRHVVGTPVADDCLVYEDPDERFFVDVTASRSRAWLFISSESKVTSEVSVVPADRPEAPPRPILPRRHGVLYYADHQGDHFYLVTDEEALDGKLVRVAVSGGSTEEVLPHRPGIKLDSPDAFSGHVVVWGRRNGLTNATVVRADAGQKDLSFDESLYRIGPDLNFEYDSDVLRLRYESLVTPLSVYDEDLAGGGRTLLKQTPVLGGYDPTDYEMERIWATGTGGASIPISLVRRRDLVARPAPLVLYGYGSYEHSVEPRFSAARLSLLDRGVVFAIAHVRGGGEMGRGWYEHGKMAEKSNTFTDFIAAAEYLVATGVTTPERLAARGGSAGGLLMGVVANLRPDLFSAIVAEVPFVDVVNTMLDESLPLTVVEWEEWGNPAIADEYGWMRGYAPYENVREMAYPAILATAGLNDPRVQYWEPAKWVAELRRRNTGSARVLLKTELGAGHGGRSGRYDAWRDEAFILAFILEELGVA